MAAYLHDAVRTARGKARPDGGLASFKPWELVGGLIEALKARGVNPSAVEALILGCVGQVEAQGGNIALISKLHAGLPDAAAAWTINNYCVSGLTAVGQAAGMVETGAASAVLAGGVEMMSRVPFMADRADYYEDAEFPPRTRFIPVAVAADRLAEDVGISREDMDAAALDSQRKTAAAEGTPLVASRIALGGLDREECARPKTSPESLAALGPAFGDLAARYAAALDGRVIDHRHTVSHAPPMADGAGLAMVSSKRDGARARILSHVEVGGDPAASLTAGFSAMDQALTRAGLNLRDMDRIEFMEAFAVTIAMFLRDREVDPERVNVGGGHLAKGHPMGATGVILLSSLMDALDACEGRYGLVAAAGAQGVGSAMIIERLA
jgi:acetyl-CoA C-acetyltransferase